MLEMIQDVKQKRVEWKDVDKECIQNLIDILTQNKEYFSFLMVNYGSRLELGLFEPNTEKTKYIYTLANATKEDIEKIIKDLEVYLNE